MQIGAPGVGITTTGLERASGGIVDASGTSMAVAMVAGAAALVATRLEQQSNGDAGGTPPAYSTIRDRILDGADHVCELMSYFEQGRRMNVYNAVHGLRGHSDACCQP